MGYTIQTEFEIGDTAYLLMYKDINIYDDCDICNGTGRIYIKDKVFLCPNFGCTKGQVRKREKREWYQRRVRITGVNIVFEVDDGENIDHYIEYSTDYLYDYELRNKELFATEAEALAECDKRNNAMEVQ